MINFVEIYRDFINITCFYLASKVLINNRYELLRANSSKERWLMKNTLKNKDYYIKRKIYLQILSYNILHGPGREISYFGQMLSARLTISNRF